MMGRWGGRTPDVRMPDMRAAERARGLSVIVRTQSLPELCKRVEGFFKPGKQKKSSKQRLQEIVDGME